VQSAARNAAAAVVPLSAAVLPAALPGTQLLAAVPCGTAVAHVAVLAAGTPTTPSDVNINHQQISNVLLHHLNTYQANMAER